MIGQMNSAMIQTGIAAEDRPFAAHHGAQRAPFGGEAVFAYHAVVSRIADSHRLNPAALCR